MSDRDYFTLAQRVRTRGSAELLELVELTKLGESCEPPTDESDIWDWADNFAKPLMRELSSRLLRMADRRSTSHAELMQVGNDMRESQKTFFKARTKANLKKSIDLERRFDALMANGSQLSLWDTAESNSPEVSA